MKHGKRPTLKQKKLIQTFLPKSIVKEFLVTKDTPLEMVLVNKNTDELLTISKISQASWASLNAQNVEV